ncbi:ABC transporter substrate-binding protein [Halobaculum rubrum]|uniref:ABC transporter substrate-binding protein n=1 Tax=Halobaculum rubrum TaxID=2872158 RepID=UPI001CA42816|nr:ABC transporter substrate-binding protein [Halobaculum rubrum]QZX98938.1 ABC transporter substrate-binding protein [Halobaculum rubrum]
MKNTELNRRDVVKGAGALGAAGMVGLAGCSGGGGGDAPVEALHAWTGGDGATAAEALEEAFNEEYPDTELEMNPIGGGGNQNLDAVVANRLQNDNPPSTFANWPGPNLGRYEGVLGDISDLWEEAGFADSHVQEAVDLHQYNGAFRAVPLGSHRLNCLFYNTSVVEEAGVDPSSLNSVSALVDALETVASETDKTPMTHGASGTWTTTQLFGVTLLGSAGYDEYMNFVEGNPSEDAVRSAFESLATILENYINDDAASIGLTESNQNIIQGEAAFIHQGNWAAGAYRNAEDFEYESDWGFKTFPGTEGMYTLHFDSFLFPSNNPSPENTRTWLEFVGGETAQVAFNQYKGSIPTRTDVDMSDFGPYLQQTAEDFADADERPPNIQHGLGITAEQRSTLNDVISSEFSGPYNVDAATQGFVDAVSN